MCLLLQIWIIVGEYHKNVDEYYKNIYDKGDLYQSLVGVNKIQMLHHNLWIALNCYI